MTITAEQLEKYSQEEKEEVYNKICADLALVAPLIAAVEEVGYADKKWGGIQHDGKEESIASMIIFMEKCLADAKKELWGGEFRDARSLDNIRKVAGLALATMRAFGTVRRGDMPRQEG